MERPADEEVEAWAREAELGEAAPSEGERPLERDRRLSDSGINAWVAALTQNRGAVLLRGDPD
jgi:hypothetical protein